MLWDTRSVAYAFDEALPKPANDTGLKPKPYSWNNATVYGGDLPEALLERKITIASGRNAMHPRGRWKNKTAPLGYLVQLLSTHTEDVNKDSECILQGETIEGTRQATAIRALHLLMLDLDTGESMDRVRDRIQELGLFSVMWSTHSHRKATTEVKKDTVIAWAKLDGVEPTAADVVRYLTEEKRYQPSILVGAKLLDTVHTGKGVQLVLAHKPMDKFRVLFMLDKPFVIAERVGSQRDGIQEWHERYAGVSEMLGAAYDRSCVDPSRLMYLPRHAPGAPFEISIINGKPLDLDKVDRVGKSKKSVIDNPFTDAAADSGVRIDDFEPVTKGLLRFAKKHGKNFEMDDFLLAVDPDGDRGARASGPGRTHRCPNDDAHSDAGNPDDKGFFCTNGTETDSGFAAFCSHDSCQPPDRLRFLDLACVAAGIEDAKELMEWVAETVEDDEEVEGAVATVASSAMDGSIVLPNKSFKSEAEADAAIEKVSKGDAGMTTAVAQCIGISPKLGSLERATLIARLGDASKIDKRKIAKVVEEAAASAGDSAYDDGAVLKALREMNRTYAVCEAGSKIRMLREMDGKSNPPKIMEIDGIRNKLSNRKVPVVDANGNTKMESVFKLWMDWPGRREYDGIEFEPPPIKPTKGFYNFWSGLAVEPEDGDWSMLHDHIRDNICHDNLEWYNWLMTWCAQAVQYPGQKLGSSVAIRGQKGTGKSKPFDWFRKIFGRHAIKVSQRSHVTGQFNGHQRGMVLLVCEEAFWAGDQQSEGALKDLITSDQMMLESKGNDAIQMSNYTRVVFLSNSKWIVPAGLEDERRYFVLEALETRRGDRAFFGALDKQMEDGGLAAMAKFFLEWEPPNGDWGILRSPPVTPWLLDQARESMDGVDGVILDMLNDGYYADEDDCSERKTLNENEKTRIPMPTLKVWIKARLKNTPTKGPRDLEGAIETAAKQFIKGYEIAKARPTPGENNTRCLIIPALSVIRADLEERKVLRKLEDLDEPEQARKVG